MMLALPALFAFVCGRGAQEKTIAELKGEFALDIVPHESLRGQQRVAAAERAGAQPHPEFSARHRRRAETALAQMDLRLSARSMRTFRFLVIARAGRVVRIGGRTRLRLAQNPSVQQVYKRLEHALTA